MGSDDVDNFRKLDEYGGRLNTAFNETDILLGLCLSIELARTNSFHDWIRPQRLPLYEDLSSDATSSSIDADEDDEDGGRGWLKYINPRAHQQSDEI